MACYKIGKHNKATHEERKKTLHVFIVNFLNKNLKILVLQM